MRPSDGKTAAKQRTAHVTPQLKPALLVLLPLLRQTSPKGLAAVV
ncbi:hypothetical protein ANACOL_02747 [Anaerotruncus colihominis DSM 17241]|uniref:Uncharacterized protein n=1 Tax=Anaerotruncus colihominis DSM 17241 TaxID=445972 RepID=B0PDW2_9FIRM|nr:hypothetical protein ANACOL_02747 [Anaerotruncus colihominis DSM 17241]